MKLQMVGCSHHTAPVEVRERLAFSRDQAAEALSRFAQQYPGDRGGAAFDVQPRGAVHRQRDARHLPVASRRGRSSWPSFTASIRSTLFNDLFERTGEDFVRHLFTVAASLDSMVVGEAQILSQVKQAYELATSGQRPAR